MLNNANHETVSILAGNDPGGVLACLVETLARQAITAPRSEQNRLSETLEHLCRAVRALNGRT